MTNGLPANDLLRLWELCFPLHPIDRAVTLLAAFWPQRSFDQWAALSIGRRNARLLNLRRKVFGSRLDGCSHCPGCSEAVEFRLRCEELLADAPSQPQAEEVVVDHQGYRLRMRLLTSRDLAAVAGCPDVVAARTTLLERSVVEARHNETPVAAADLPAAVQAVVNAKLARIDPLGEIRMAFDCPACGHRWRENLDVAAFFWEELNHRVRRLFREVHVLARAYGWPEADILALNEQRRNIYLQMVFA